MKLDKEEAKALLRSQASLAQTSDNVSPKWRQKIEHLSQLCIVGTSKTHIAFLGTVLLAKALDRNVDLYAIKPNLDSANARAFSARTLCHAVLVPLAAEIGFSIGVTGREPLNNQPYFRMSRLGDQTPIHAGARVAFDYMLEMVRELQGSPDELEAIQGLRAFIAVRQLHLTTYRVAEERFDLTPEQLVFAIRTFVREDSERGKRAQAIVAGLLDAFVGYARVDSGRINDPSRNNPGDVCIRSIDVPDFFEKAFEVRDKPVTFSDIQIFGRTCIEFGIRDVAVVAVSERQQMIDRSVLESWCASLGIGMTIFIGWETFIDQVLFWCELPKPEAAVQAAECIEQRLVEIEALPESVQRWQVLVRTRAPT